MREIGMRVGAVRSADDDAVYLFGYGVYEGDFMPPDSVLGLDVPDNFRNPRIKLDNGNTVWGCQCWWGPEDQIKRMIGERTIVEVCP